MKTLISNRRTSAVEVHPRTTLRTTFIPGLLSRASLMLLLVAAFVLPGAAQTVYVSNYGNFGQGNGSFISEYYADGTLIPSFTISNYFYETWGFAASGPSLIVPVESLSPVFPGWVGEYDGANGNLLGTLVNFVNTPHGAAVSGSFLFVLYDSGTVGEYWAATGQPINTMLGAVPAGQAGAYIAAAPGLNGSVNVFVTAEGVLGQPNTGSVQQIEVTDPVTGTANAPVGAVSALTYPAGVAVSADGRELYVVTAEAPNGPAGLYACPVSNFPCSPTSSLTQLNISNSVPTDVAVSGSNLFVTLNTANAIGEYNLNTKAWNPTWAALTAPLGIAVGPGTCVAPPNDMVAWYPFDQTGSAQDDLAYGNTATAYGTTSIAGEVSNALDFDGSSSYVEAQDQTWLNIGANEDFSIDAWVKINSAADDRGVVVLLDKRESSPIQGYHFFLYNGLLGLQMANNGNYTNYVSAKAVPADGAWHLVAVTVHRAKNGGTWYLDNQAVGTFDPSAYDDLSLVSTGTPLVIGEREAGLGGGGFFKGGMDELEIFNVALSPAEVLSLYHAGSAGKCKY